MLSGPSPFPNPLHQQLDCCYSDRGPELVDCCQGDEGVTRHVDVVVAHHGHVFRTKSKVGESPERAHGERVVSGENRGRWITPFEKSPGRFVTTLLGALRVLDL